MKFGKFQIGVLLLLACIVIVGCKKTNTQESTMPVGEEQMEQVDVREVSNPELEDNYEEVVGDIMDDYWQSGAVSDLQDRLLAVTAPGRYLDLHLSLVLAFENLAGSSEQQAKGAATIDELADEYRWLR